MGDYGWFYGDFFIPSEYYKPQICYAGIYRYFNNPDCITGHLACYGLALITQSTLLCSISFFSQLTNIAFVCLIEVPHMRRLYRKQLRNNSPIPIALKRGIDKQIEKVERIIERSDTNHIISKSHTKLKENSRKVRLKIIQEIIELFSRIYGNKIINEYSEERNDDAEITQISIKNSIDSGEELEVKYETISSHSEYD